MKHIIHISEQKCIGCNQCINDCPTSNISLQQGKAKLVEQDCILCGHCVAICPKSAVTISGYENSPIEISTPPSLPTDDLLMMVKSSRSIRSFSEKPVDDELLQKILEIGQFSPTAKNAQDVSYIVLKNKIHSVEEKAVRFIRRILPLVKGFNKSANRVNIDDHFLFKNAPLVILIVTKNQTNGIIASTHMALMAESLGLGVLYSGFFTMIANVSNSIKKDLGLKINDHIAATLVVGYSNVKYKRTTQKENVNVRVL